jgi:biopolymer transport protein ExbD
LYNRLLLTLTLLLVYSISYTQDSSIQLPSAYLSTVENKVSSLTGKLDQKTAKYLQAFQKREAKLLRKLARKDSTKAAQLLATSKAKYQQLEQALKGEKALQEYIPSLDTLTTSLKFLTQHKELLANTKEAQDKLKNTLGKVDGLQSSLGKAEAVNQFLKERQQSLTSQLKDLPFAKDLTKLSKQAYYYKAQVEEYKAILKDKKKGEQKALQLLSQTKAYQSFMRKHSQLASLFRLPGLEGEPSNTSLEGLQTRSQINSLLQERFGSDPQTVAQLRDNVQAAQGQLNTLKSKAESLKSGSVGNSNGDITQPNFKPNQQKTKSFRQRLEIGTNIQSQKARWSFPVTSDLGLSLGYKLNNRSVIGIGGSYKLGLGRGWDNIAISHQGVGIRSYIDYQLKGSFFLSGGYEQNYRSEIRTIEALKDRSTWQSSGLIGLSKKYKVSQKLKGQMQLLWDFLSYKQLPQTQALVFRIGYTLK